MDEPRNVATVDDVLAILEMLASIYQVFDGLFRAVTVMQPEGADRDKVLGHLRDTANALEDLTRRMTAHLDELIKRS